MATHRLKRAARTEKDFFERALVFARETDASRARMLAAAAGKARSRATARGTKAAASPRPEVATVELDLDRLLSVLTPARREILRAVMHGVRTVSDLARISGRLSSALSRDIKVLGESGLVLIETKVNPGHGVHKVVRAVAPTIEIRTLFASSADASRKRSKPKSRAARELEAA